MSVEPILSIGHPTLRKVSEPISVEEITRSSTKQLLTNLVDTMRSANGAGLAANQIDVPLRAVVMEVHSNPRYPYKPNIPLTIAINPTIEPLGEETVLINEGCLSVPLRGDVRRHVNIRVTYYDETGQFHDEVKRGLTAGTWQHEVDHLDGVLMIDRVEDVSTLATWGEFERFQKATFVERITAFVEEVGS